MRERTPLFSIVVPVYNNEQYLDQCLKSLTEQTEENIEILVVDDGSTDSSGEICDAWAKQDERIRVFHQPNSGVVKACRTGFDAATGLYFTKVDSDDWVESDFCEVLGHYLLENDLDMIISDYISERLGDNVETGYVKDVVMSGYELVKTHGKVNTSGDICYTWRMAFSIAFLRENNLFFGEGMRIGEDTVLNVTSLSKADRVMAIDYAGYHYRDSENGVMRSKYKPTLEKDLNTQYYIRTDCFSGLDSYMHDLSLYYINTLFYSVLNNCKNSSGGLQCEDVRRILKTVWVKESFKFLGFRLPAYSAKEYILLCIAKFRLAKLYYYIIRLSDEK